MGHPEPLLLVDHEQAEVAERHVLAEQPVGADHDVDLAGLHVLDDLLLLGVAHEAAEHLHRDGERREPLAERDEVLLGEERRRHEHGDLLAFHHGLEGGPHRDLGLAEPDVAADQPVHRLGQHHVGLDLVDRRDLVAGLLVWEGVLELPLPRRVGANA